MHFVVTILFIYVVTTNGQSRWTSTNCPGCKPCIPETCGPNDAFCECFLTVEHRLSMTMENERMAVFPRRGELFKFSDTSNPLSASEDIITADGASSRLIIAINRQFPGPAIYAYEGQTLVIHVRNLMHTESVTVHWHGQHQKGTPYSDGVAFVTQCPILPGHKYTYNFKAAPHGTSFYHAHIGDQRSMGLYGPLIIYKKSRNARVEPPEHIVSLQDWNHDDEPETLYQRMLRGVFELRPTSRITHNPTQSIDGASFSNFHMHSGIINGKGRFYTSISDHNESPLSVFEVERFKEYRFRVIGAMTLYPLRVYVQDHREITVVASDGFDIEPIPVESFIIQPGERIDFILKTDLEPSEYLLVAESIESNVRSDQYHAAEAIIRYKETTTIRNNLPKAAVHSCSSTQPCVVFNCPYLYYPASNYRTCKTFNDAKSMDSNSRTTDIIGTNVVTKFYNFAFPGWLGNTPASVNGRQFLSPIEPPLLQPKRMSNICSDKECEYNSICECASSDTLNGNVIYQFVLTNIGSGSGWSHPVHLHGHSFYVLKLGFGRYDTNNAKLLEETKDIVCTHKFCNEADWANDKIAIDGLNFDNPVQKDTIVVPTGGYVVIRFKADNPGLWFFHCHIDLHNTNGMGMMLNESYNSYPTNPNGLPSCVEYVRYRYPESASGSNHIGQMTVFGSVETCVCFVVLLCGVVWKH